MSVSKDVAGILAKLGPVQAPAVVAVEYQPPRQILSTSQALTRAAEVFGGPMAVVSEPVGVQGYIVGRKAGGIWAVRGEGASWDEAFADALAWPDGPRPPHLAHVIVKGCKYKKETKA